MMSSAIESGVYTYQDHTVALLGKISQRQPEFSKRKLTTSDAEWRLFETPNGRLLKFSTLGSKDRQSEPKASQVVHFDRKASRELIEIFVAAYGHQIVDGIAPN